MKKNIINSKKILIIGDWIWPIYEHALEMGFRYFKNKVYKFSTEYFFKKDIISLIQKKIRLGPIIKDIKNECLIQIKEIKPDLIFFQRNYLFPPSFF